MSDTSEFEQVDDNTQPGKLRQLLEQALASNKQLTAKVTEMETAATQVAVKSTWDELQVPDPIRKLYNGDTSADAIKAWWQESQGLFNIQAAGEQPAEQTATPEQQAQLQAAQQVQQASAIGTNAVTSGFDAALAKANEAKALASKGGRTAEWQAARDAFYASEGTRAY